MFASSFFEGSENDCNEFCSNIGDNSRKEVVQLKGNWIPKGLVSLERLFDCNDRYVKEDVPQATDTSREYEKINLGDENNPKMVNLGRCCNPKEKRLFTKLLQKYFDVFSWSYEDLKDFKNGQFQHHIPLKSRAARFIQKLRNYNPKVADAIFKEIYKII